VKRYLSCHLTKELCYRDEGIVEIRPYVFCIVQSIPGFISARDYFMEGIHRKIMMPHFKNFFIVHQLLPDN